MGTETGILSTRNKMADAYGEVVGGSLKLKLGVADGGVKK